ncbi:hypothetical protein FHP05_03865 [Cerasibacillus terrae]|uniref:Uncharacterized protein n=1 Tax=Cerasibacillus terrae TaxID=2498845 RepID=A0A5C8NZQ0_9BACI|nr:hypothetical protein [Cerasibacillus terrae]TXL66532.1 hypothetical protein FHP05_03865 [Cerasibacillus terrae]
MDKELQQLVDETQKKFGLKNYYLGRSHLHREKSHCRETLYYFSMEWFPNQFKNWDKEDENPKGTASIEIDLHTKSLRSIIFVGGITYAENESVFPTYDLESVIEWVEEQTGLMWGRQFQLVHEKKDNFLFRGVVDNVPIYPSATIEVKFNQAREFSFYSMIGDLPKENEVQWEPFSLVPETLEPVLKDQITLIELPHLENKKWNAVYAVEEVFITNDKTKTIPYDIFQRYGEKVEVNKVMEWEEPLQDEFVGKPLFVFEEVSMEQAQTKEDHPDFLPITKSEAKAAIQETRDLLRREYPNDSGKWMLKTILREEGYIVSLLKPIHSERKVFGDKLKIAMNRDTLQTVNYIDSSILLTELKDYEKVNEINISEKEAFEKLRKYIKVTPTYVYDPSVERYRLCGKIDSDYGVHATTGKVVHLDEL